MRGNRSGGTVHGIEVLRGSGPARSRARAASQHFEIFVALFGSLYVVMMYTLTQ